MESSNQAKEILVMPYFMIIADDKNLSIQAEDIIAAYNKAIDMDIIKQRKNPMFTIIETDPPQTNPEYFAYL
jgi:hypothetical protein